MEKCANAIADWLVRCAMIDEEDKELYGYAAYSLILSISPLLLAIGFGIGMGRVKESVMITLPFMLIRKFSGGYHTKHAWSCMICSCLLLFLCITLSSYITAGWLLNFFTIGATVSLICFSPIQHENRVLDQEEGLCILHLGELASNNVVHDLRNGTEYTEPVKEMSDEIYLRDSFEKIARPVEYVCNCDPNFSISKGMPKSIFADQFGYDMQKDISEHMKEFYAGKINKDELNDYFEECCSSMRIYRTQQCQTSGQNDNDNEQIVGQMYEIFAKENLRVARDVNYLEGEKINLTCG